ncbi:hypothetical protein ACGFNU_26010 [Spirillospora sp. NPDC048911]|uniref:hypothetical protein n=1 Tax=Spirillospora sp. NPDC048911 TaxID=3364527 RepID=UPI0037153957
MNEPNGPRALGGEMPRWSDLASGVPAAGGEPLAELVRRTMPDGARALVVGPHDPALLDLLVKRAGHVTYVLRSLPDAEQAADRYGSAEVVCGGFDRFDGSGSHEPYDVIIALDGLRRLVTPEHPESSWARFRDRLTGMLAVDGTLLLGVENPFGVHRLLAADGAEFDSVRNWQPAQALLAPSSFDLFVGGVAEAGLRVDRLYAGYPSSEQPGVLLGAGALSDDIAKDVAVSACRKGLAGRELLGDPCALVRQAFQGGQGERFAASWFAVARGAAAPVDGLPDVLVAEGPGAAEWSVPVELVLDRPWSRRPCPESLEPRTSGRVTRVPADLAGPYPRGDLLLDLLVEACAAADLVRLRALLTGYADWLAEEASGRRAAFATPGNVVLDGERFAMLDPGWAFAGPVPPEQVLARMLLSFAAVLATGAHSHPWPPTLTVHDLTDLLHVMAGRPADARLRGVAIQLEAEIGAAQAGLPASARDRLANALACGEVAVAAAPMGHRELLSAHRELTAGLRAVRSRAGWAERQLARKDKELAKQQVKIAKLEANLVSVRGSVSYRAGRVLTAPARRLAGLAGWTRSPGRR